MADSGRAPSGQALVASDEAATHLHPSGFDPSRLSSLSFVLPYDDGSERLEVMHDERSRHWRNQVAIRQYGSDDYVLYVDLADINWLIGALKLVAIATEAGTAETTKIGSVEDEGAGRRHRPDTGMTQGEEKGR